MKAATTILKTLVKGEMDLQTKNHYENHLSAYYSWISGGLEDNFKKNIEFFRSHGIFPSASKSAIDLGAGPGFQSVPLSQTGFDVTAVDFSRKLLAEIDSEKHGIEIIEADILDFEKYAGRNPELITCMGDTLTHLPDMDSVKLLVANSFNELSPGGRIVLTFRDLTSRLEGTDRFITVKSEPDRIFTCFLEYGTDHVDVYDMVNRMDNGRWVREISTYSKTIISEEDIKTILGEYGFKPDYFEKSGGVFTIIGSRE